MAKILAIILNLYIIFSSIYGVYSTDLGNVDELKSVELPPCAACKVVVDSFKKGLDNTSRGKFEGGDSAWEAEKGPYAKSEVRLTEIQEGLCKEVKEGQKQCHALAAESEQMIEEWWFRHQNRKDLFRFLCIEKTKRCCPENHYGPQCIPCAGYPNNICNKNGKCKGAGTRKGNGQCQCDQGYSGEDCSKCAPGHYESYRDGRIVLCSFCHSACDGSCKGPGPRDCEKCAKGWQFLEGQGCLDINECVLGKKNCPGNQFCVNKEGGYSCLKCDRACNGCHGDGPDMCFKCAIGYKKKGSMCVNIEALGRQKQENVTRYATYLGLCISTCIILQRNIVMAGAIGIVVSIYITLSEYMISNIHLYDNSPNVEDFVSPAA
ncbi:cysteine-rich with EGF-like domain protein 2 [Cephus cinctus]|uniref:Cysteine-rich with EGF-like domain protein 2 n=1 Tax=Cephus cinctus TaxID=211228 RepID=A0AAJ7C1G2_CEPCN|nr:cysteine-rich with EGF-like domain protein 2 [Cephus cinctus]